MKKFVIIIEIIIGVTTMFILSYQIINDIVVNSTKNYNNNIINGSIAQSNINRQNDLFYQYDNETDKTTDKVTMKIKQGTLTKTSAVILIVDNNIPPYTYREWFRIEQKVGEKWQEKAKLTNEDGWLNYTFTEQTIFTEDDGTLELETKWADLYGELEEGQYRLVKRIGEQYFYIEFRIE